MVHGPPLSGDAGRGAHEGEAKQKREPDHGGQDLEGPVESLGPRTATAQPAAATAMTMEESSRARRRITSWRSSARLLKKWTTSGPWRTSRPPKATNPMATLTTPMTAISTKGQTTAPTASETTPPSTVATNPTTPVAATNQPPHLGLSLIGLAGDDGGPVGVHTAQPVSPGAGGDGKHEEQHDRGTSPEPRSATRATTRTTVAAAEQRPPVAIRHLGQLGTSSSEASNMPSTVESNSRAIRKARGSEGEYRPVSIAITV